MNNKKYNMAFTGGALLLRESVLIAQKFIKCNDWDDVKRVIDKENLLQVRTVSSSKRICREVILRLKELSNEELNQLIVSGENEQAAILWIAICRRYRFIADFAKEVLREHVVTLNRKIDYEDFNAFFNRRSEWHPELESVTETTRKKLRQIVFRMMREADFIEKDNSINEMDINPSLAEVIVKNNRDELFFFPFYNISYS